MAARRRSRPSSRPSTPRTRTGGSGSSRPACAADQRRADRPTGWSMSRSMPRASRVACCTRGTCHGASADLAVGEAVLVEYGRRQAVGVVLRERPVRRMPTRPTKPVLARVRSDGPLLTPLQARLAIHVSEHYLAPAAMVVRQMLPPGELERIELVAVRGRTGDRGVAAGMDAPPGMCPRPPRARRLTPTGCSWMPSARPSTACLSMTCRMERNRATTLRRLRALADDGRIAVASGGCGPRPCRPGLERRVHPHPGRRCRREQLAAGERPPGASAWARARRRSCWSSPTACPNRGIAAARLAERHGASAVSGTRAARLAGAGRGDPRASAARRAIAGRA